MKKKVSKKDETANNAKANVSGSAIVRKKTYTIEWLEHEDGKCTMNRRTEGFEAFELLGIITLTQFEIMQQVKGIIKPDIINRTFVREEK